MNTRPGPGLIALTNRFPGAAGGVRNSPDA